MVITGTVQVDSAARSQVFAAVATYRKSPSYAMLPAVPVAVGDAGTLDHVRPEPPLAAMSSQLLFPA
jgi:hypothetical protein